MKIVLTTILCIVTMLSNAQDFNKWSIGASIGIHDGMSPSKARTRAFQFQHFGGNVRYMFNNRFGIMGDVGYDLFDFYKKPYNTNYFRVSLQGVINVGDMLHFSSFTKRFGLLAHGGFGFSTMWQKGHPQGKSGPDIKGNDDMMNFIFGLAPQIKLNEHWSLNVDLGFIFHHNQTYRFDMQGKSKHGAIDGYFNTLTVGVTYYIGKKKSHADWTPTVYGGESDNSDLTARLAAMEEALKDDDGDGVPNGRDLEAATPANSYVNSKGEAIVEKEVVDLDKDKDGFLDAVDECPDVPGIANGCPDSDHDEVPDYRDSCPGEYGIKELNGCALTKEELDVIQQASESIYFNSGKAIIKSESFEGLDKLAKILNDHQDVAAMIEGHTDNVGNANANLLLSKERAAAVVTYLVSKGVSKDRLTSEGYGSTQPIVSNDTEEGRAKNRRVKITTSTFKK